MPDARQRGVDTYTDDHGVTHTISAGPKGQNDRLPIPTHWPAIPAVDAEVEWLELRQWVEDLKQRFPVLDHHVIPACWWRHNEHVEALAALRDHEKSSYSDLSAATAPIEWIRALRDVATILTGWTAELCCGALHQDPPDTLHASYYEGWEQHWQNDRNRRKRLAIDLAAGGASGGPPANE